MPKIYTCIGFLSHWKPEICAIAKGFGNLMFWWFCIEKFIKNLNYNLTFRAMK